MGEEKEKPGTQSLAGKITLWITVVSGVVTLLLTVYNAVTSSRIQQREEDLKALDMNLKSRAQDVDQQKANVERYQWVFSHFTDMENTDVRKRTFVTSLVRLALSKEEAEQLFNSFQNSSDTLLQAVGQSGIANINSEPIAALVGRLDAATSADRIDAFNELKNKYLSSSAAIDLVLNLYTQGRMNKLSPNGFINGLYFLGGTDPNAWSKQQMQQASRLLPELNKLKPGPKTKEAINYFKQQADKLYGLMR